MLLSFDMSVIADNMGTYIFRYILPYIIESIGMLLICIKCEEKHRLLCFVPAFRYLTIGDCGSKEKESRVIIWLTLLDNILTLLFKTVDQEAYQAALQQSELNITDDVRIALFSGVLEFAVLIALLIYKARLYGGLCDRFMKKKRWVWLFVLIEPVPLFLWGVLKNIKPLYKDEGTLPEGAEISGISANLIRDGLTVDIRERLAKNGTKSVRLLKDIHLSIPKGHMVLLLGGSGAGKTTFLNAMTGYEPADADIMLNNKNLYQDYEKMKYDIGFVPQQDLMRGNDTVYRTLSDAATLRLPDNITPAARKQRVEEVLEGFGLNMLKNTLVEKLSGGQRKRLSIAMEFISDPKLFILDEPDSGLDGVVARSLFNKLRSIADDGKIVVVITHTPDRVIDLFDDVIVLAKDVDRTGRLAYYGPIDESLKFFEKPGMENILLAINQKEEGGEGRANEFVSKYSSMLINNAKAGNAV